MLLLCYCCRCCCCSCCWHYYCCWLCCCCCCFCPSLLALLASQRTRLSISFIRVYQTFHWHVASVVVVAFVLPVVVAVVVGFVKLPFWLLCSIFVLWSTLQTQTVRGRVWLTLSAIVFEFYERVQKRLIIVAQLAAWLRNTHTPTQLNRFSGRVGMIFSQVEPSTNCSYAWYLNLWLYLRFHF